jgi:hypothetical protein
LLDRKFFQESSSFGNLSSSAMNPIILRIRTLRRVTSRRAYRGMVMGIIIKRKFPFGHSFGRPKDTATQRRVLETALQVLAGASAQGTRVDLDLLWPEPRGVAYKSWQPAEPSPIVAMMLARQKS